MLLALLVPYLSEIFFEIASSIKRFIHPKGLFKTFLLPLLFIEIARVFKEQPTSPLQHVFL